MTSTHSTYFNVKKNDSNIKCKSNIIDNFKYDVFTAYN